METLACEDEASWTREMPRSWPATQRDWVSRTGSLTAHLHTIGIVCVHVLSERPSAASADELACFTNTDNETVWMRDVILMIDHEPVVVGHSVTPLRDSETHWRAMRSLNTRPLAEILFNDQEIKRSHFSYRSLAMTHPLLCHMRTHFPKAALEPCCARRSLFAHRGSPLLVTECFLPALWAKVLSMHANPALLDKP